MEASVGVWRTGGHWYARPNPGLCASRSAHRRVHERAAADGCRALWPPGRTASAAVPGLEWAGLARDGAMPHAPLGGPQVGKPPTDRGPIGTQRSRRADGGGVPLGLAVAGAQRHDGKLVEATRTKIPRACPPPTLAPSPGRCLDQGADEDEVRARLAEGGFTAHSRARGEAATALQPATGGQARRGGVERTPRGMHRCRRVRMRGDKTVGHDRACLPVACASMTDRQAGLVG
jgi:putative transposase